MNESEETVKGQTSDRRRLGEGTVDQRPSGKWRARVRLPDGSRVSKTFNTEAEADSFRRGVVSVTAEGGDTGDDGPVTLRSITDAWFKQRELDGVRGFEREKYIWERHVLSHPIADMPVETIDRPAVVVWRDDVRATFATVPTCKGRRETRRKLSHQTVSGALRLVRSALGWACDTGHIALNPAQGVKMPRAQGKKIDAWTWLTVEEIEAIETCEAIPQRERALYTVAIRTGLRRGELWALQHRDVTLGGDAPELVVRGSHGDATKNGKVRRVPLLPSASAALKAWFATLEQKRPEDYVFASETGGRRGHTDDARWAPQWRKNKAGERVQINGYRLRAGVTRRVRFHDMRHTCASHLVQGSWGLTLTLAEAREWLGHSAISVTERYAHLSPDRLATRVAQATAKTLATGPNEAPALGPDHGRAASGNTMKTGGTPGAIRTRDNRLRSPEGAPATTAPYAISGPTWDPQAAQNAAKSLLITVAQGQSVGPELIDALVSAVLGTEVVTLALAAREQGPSSLMYALRLAAAVCEAGAAWEALKIGGGR